MKWNWEQLCGHPNYTVSEERECFGLFAFVSGTHVILAITSAYYLSHDQHRRLRGVVPHSPTLWLRLIVSLLLMLSPVIAIILVFLYETYHPSLVSIISACISALSWFIHSGYVWRLRRLYHIPIRGHTIVIISFLLTTASTGIQLYSAIQDLLHTKSLLTKVEDIIRCVVTGLHFLYALTLLACNRPPVSTDSSGSGNIQRRGSSEGDSLLGSTRVGDYGTIEHSSSLGTAEDGSNCLSKLFFAWVQPLMVRGAKGRLSNTTDLFQLPKRLRTVLVEEKFTEVMKRYTEQLKETEAGQSRRRLAESQANESLRSLPEVAITNGQTSSSNQTAFAKQNKDSSPDKVRLITALNKAFGWEYYSLGLLKLIGDSFTFAGPMLLNLLVSYMENSQEASWHGYVYAAGLFASTFLGSMLLTHFGYMVQIVGFKVRAAIITSVYKKALLVSSVSLSKFSTGEVVNFMSTDTDRIINFCPSFHQFWSLPFQMGVSLYLLHQQVGLAFLAGLGFAVLLIPVNRWLAIKIGELSTRMMNQKDARVKLMSELLVGIRVIKFYAWEDHMSQRIKRLREAELESLKGRKYLDAMCVFFWATTQVLISILTFTTYVLLGHELTAAKVFTSMALFNILIMPLNAFPWVLNGLMEAWVSIKRLTAYLQLSDLDWQRYYSENLGVSPNTVICIQNGQFSWQSMDSDLLTSNPVNSDPVTSDPGTSDHEILDPAMPEEQSTRSPLIDDQNQEPEHDHQRKGTLRLRSIDLVVEKGQLVGVMGKVGCGKSSLLSAILAEMTLESGEIQVTDLSGGFGLVAQESWIQHATVKDNIVFGKEFDQGKYSAVIEACALHDDLKVLPAGDETEIGENGVTLSGGQKARVALARAVYQDKDIYLLDDPLAAVDAHVAKHLFDKCIMGILRKKTRILCTHHVHFLQKADHVIAMESGSIVKSGHPDDILNAVEHTDLGKKEKRAHSVDDAEGSSSQLEAGTEDGALVQEEEKDTGVVKFHVYKAYWVAVGHCLATMVLLSLVLMQASRNLSDWWLSYWVTHSHTRGQHPNSSHLLMMSIQEDSYRSLPTSSPWSNLNGSSDNVKFYLTVYGSLAGANSVFTFARAFLFAYGGLCAATELHKQLLASILKAPVAFFDITPIGRIINRFSSDVYAIDDSLPFMLNIVLAMTFGVLGTLAITCYGLPWFVIPLVPLGVLYFFIQRYYRHTSRELKRISSVTLSPIYAHFSESVSGLATIRALRETHRFQSENRTRLEDNQRAQFASQAASQWLNIRLQMIGVAMVTAVAFIAVLEHHFHTVNPGLVGLAISYALSITGLLNGMVTFFTETEKQMVAVERASNYIHDIPREKHWAVLEVPPFWPIQGAIIFHRVELQYRSGLPLALQSVTFETQPAEKIGIVGRTGAGKSSLFLALFRMVELKEGNIEIDGINISHLPLSQLRSRLAVIPQDPFLFSGSVRENLDPTFTYTDHELWDVLERCHLKDVVDRLGGLEADVAERGRHFSVGQRQLVCLARALLTKAKVLCIDEATASVDQETDQLLQQMIREQFINNTVLTIAHRIHTIMDSDRVLVMNRGRVAEFEPPEVLLANPNSIFYGLVHGRL